MMAAPSASLLAAPALASAAAAAPLRRPRCHAASCAAPRHALRCAFLGAAVGRPPRGRAPAALQAALPLGPSNGARTTAFFKFRQDSESAGIVGSQKRDDYDRDDVEQYFNYMGLLAVEGTYDRMYGLLDSGVHPVDAILLFATAEGDLPKIEELLKAGATVDVKDTNGASLLSLAGKNNKAKAEETKKVLMAAGAK